MSDKALQPGCPATVQRCFDKAALEQSEPVRKRIGRRPRSRPLLDISSQGIHQQACRARLDVAETLIDGLKRLDRCPDVVDELAEPVSYRVRGVQKQSGSETSERFDDFVQIGCRLDVLKRPILAKISS